MITSLTDNFASYSLVSRTLPVVQPSTSIDACLVDVIGSSTSTGHVAKKRGRPPLPAEVKAHRAAEKEKEKEKEAKNAKKLRM